MINHKPFNNRMKDLTGIKIGELYVKKYVGVTSKGNQSVWECECSCGNIKNYTIVELGKYKSCGCKRYSTGEDIINKKFGRLTVLEKIGSKNRVSIYKCKCECGNFTEVVRTNLLSGDIKSCGCLKNEFYKNELNNQIKKYQVDGTNIARLKSSNLSKTNKSGVTGVSQKKNGKWLAQIVFKRKAYNLGTYEKKEDAINARKEAEEKLHKEFLREKGIID